MTEVEEKGIKLLEALAILMLKKDQDWEVKMLTVNFWRISLSASPRSGTWMTGLKIGCEDYESSVNLQFSELIKEVGGCSELKTKCKRIIKAPLLKSYNPLKRDREENEERPVKIIRTESFKNAERNEVPDDDEEESRIQTIDDILEEPHKLLLRDLVSQECERQAKGWQRKTVAKEATVKSCWMEELPIIDPEAFLLWLNQIEEEDEEEKCQEDGDKEYGRGDVTRLMGVLEDILHSTAGASMNDLIDCY